MLAPSIICQQWLVAVLSLFADAAAGLPIIIALGLLAGRRGAASFCPFASFRLSSFAIALSVCGPVFFLASYFSQVAHYQTDWISQWRPFFAPVGLPWSSSFLAWLGGIVFLASARTAIRRLVLNLPHDNDRYPAQFVKLPVFFLLAAALFFFSAFFLVNWPFGGLPAGMEWDRAVMAVMRNGARRCFMAFCPAGACALLYVCFRLKQRTANHKRQLVRWLAVWSAAGCLPSVLLNWGVYAGISLRADILSQTQPIPFPLIFQTAAIFCWIWIIFRPKYCAWGSVCGFGLLSLKVAAPFVVSLCSVNF